MRIHLAIFTVVFTCFTIGCSISSNSSESPVSDCETYTPSEEATRRWLKVRYKSLGSESASEVSNPCPYHGVWLPSHRSPTGKCRQADVIYIPTVGGFCISDRYEDERSLSIGATPWYYKNSESGKYSP